jgi:hypothetical protein
VNNLNDAADWISPVPAFFVIFVPFLVHVLINLAASSKIGADTKARRV